MVARNAPGRARPARGKGPRPIVQPDRPRSRSTPGATGSEHGRREGEIVMEIDLEQARRRAKELARDRSLKLSEAQHQVARDLGFASWPALVRDAEDRVVHAALSG